jgi:hypothetical protein
MAQPHMLLCISKIHGSHDTLVLTLSFMTKARNSLASAFNKCCKEMEFALCPRQSRIHKPMRSVNECTTRLAIPYGCSPRSTLQQVLIQPIALSKRLYPTVFSLHAPLFMEPYKLYLAGSLFIILNLPLIADLQILQERQQQLIDERQICANRLRFSHDYHVGEEVLKLVYKPDKLQPKAEGSYLVHQVHTNGTVTLQKDAHTNE